MCAILCNEPFNRDPRDILHYTPWQVAQLLLCDRDDDGRVILEGGASTRPLPSNEEMFRRHWEYQGLRPDQIDRLWQDQLEAGPNGR